jgi:hypothetical protein
MKFFICIVFSLITLGCSKENKLETVRNDICNCFDSIKYKGDKLKFHLDEQRGMIRLNRAILSLHSVYPKKTDKEITTMILNELKTNCQSFNDVLTLYFETAKQTNLSKLTDKSKCKILKEGVFIDKIENTKITIKGDIQISELLDYNYYTKSKIKWIDSISYQLSPYESTEPIMVRHLSDSLKFNCKVIDIVEDTITYEIELNKEYSLQQLIKIK